MPTVTLDTETQLEWEELLTRHFSDDEPRTGIHVSDLTICIRQSILTRLYQPSVPAMGSLRFLFGRAFEKLVFKVFLPYATEELEVKENGIEGHIDFASDPYDFECKFSWKYVKDDPSDLFDDNFWYLDQAGMYAIMRRRTACKFAIIHVQPIPQLRIYHVEWTRRELGELWERMTRRKDYMIEVQTKIDARPNDLTVLPSRLPSPLSGKMCKGCGVYDICFRLPPKR
jgi:CRISPR/Cas system-associated exonuclease Cas4 (RecB family)